MNAQEIFDLAREYGAEHPGITFDLAALLRYTRKIQEMEREACAKLVEHYRSDWDMAETIRARGQEA
jgi:DNA-directed RNA polymerase subunit F